MHKIQELDSIILNRLFRADEPIFKAIFINLIVVYLLIRTWFYSELNDGKLATGHLPTDHNGSCPCYDDYRILFQKIQTDFKEFLKMAKNFEKFRRI